MGGWMERIGLEVFPVSPERAASFRFGEAERRRK
jgi:hypothetical protein